MKTTTQTATEYNILRAKMNATFGTLCASLGITPGSFVSLGPRSGACFYSEREAAVLVDLLRRAGIEPSVHHWDPKVDPDFDRDEWQVDWTM